MTCMIFINVTLITDGHIYVIGIGPTYKNHTRIGLPCL